MRYFILAFLILVALPALAQQTPITALPGANPLQANDLFPLDQRIGNTTTPSHVTTTNLFNQGMAIAVGTTATGPAFLTNGTPGLVNTTNAQTALNALNKTGSVGTAAYTVAPCTGSGDQTVLATAFGTKNSVSPVLYPDGCVLTGQLTLPFAGFSKLFQFGNYSTEFNTAQGGSGRTARGDPRLLINLDNIASATGQVGINVNGQQQFVIDSSTIMATGSGVRYATTMVGPTSQGNSQCCNSRTIDVINSSIGGGPTLVGCPIDGTGNCVRNGGAKAGTLTAGGSGYVNGTYANVPLTGGTGAGAVAASIVVSGGIVTSLSLATSSVLANPGAAYVIGDVLSASNTNLGGTGSGLQFTVSTLYADTTSANNYFPYIVNSFLSGMSGAAVSGNVSDGRFVNSTFTDGPAIRPTFGAGSEIGMNRFEDDTNAIVLPQGASFITGNNFTHGPPAFGFGGGPDITLSQAGGVAITGNTFDANNIGATRTGVIQLGGAGNLSDVTISGNNMYLQNQNTAYCVDIQSSHTIDYISMQGNTCDGTTIIGNVNYEQVPAHFVEDFVGPHGQHAEKGRPFGIGTSAPHPITQMAFDLSYNTTSMGLPVGTTGTRPASPVAGMLRYNSTLSQVEGYIGTAWSLLQSHLVTAFALAGNETPLTVQSFGSTTLISGQTAYWKLDDASGSTAVDAVSANNGTWAGTLGSQWGTGIVNGDGVFNGSDNVLNTTYTGVTGSGARTISLWVKTTTNTCTSADIPVFQYTTSAGQSFQLVDCFNNSGTSRPGFGIHFGGFQWVIYNAASIFNGNWHNLVAVFPASTQANAIQFYLDGVLLTSVSTQFNQTTVINTGTTTSTQIGGTTFPGQIDEVGFWSRALSATEVGLIYNNGLANQYPYTQQTANIVNVTDAVGNVFDIISPSGAVSIGTSTSTNKLDVSGTVAIGTSYAGIKTSPVNGLLVQGHVGIGTSTVVNKLDVYSASGLGVAIGSSYAGASVAPTNGLIVQGNVGVGTASPAGQFSLGNAAAHAGQSTCWTTNGQIGYCTSVVGAGGACTCTGL